MPELITTRVLALVGLKGFGKGAVVETGKKGCVYGVILREAVASEVYTQAKDHHGRRNQETIHSGMSILPFCSVLLGLFVGKVNCKQENGELS